MTVSLKPILPLLVIMTLGSVTYVLVPSEPLIRLVVVLLMVTSFILWGWHEHYLSNTLTTKVILEYLLLGILALALVIFLLYYG